MNKVMQGVTEYAEGMDVELRWEKGLPVIYAQNKAGYNCTMVDLVELLTWVKLNKPELLWETK